MSGRLSYAMHHALKSVQSGHTLSDAARQHGVDLRSLRRALRREESRARCAVEREEATQTDPAPEPAGTLRQDVTIADEQP